MKLKNVLVTGGLGYIGSKLVLLLTECGFSVRIIDANFFGSTHLTKEIGSGLVDFVEADIRDADALEKSLEGMDTVIHLAAISDDPCVDLDVKLSEAINYDASLRLLEKSKKGGIRRFINASSSTVYGVKEEQKVHEELSLEPISIYGKLKVKFEAHVRELNDKDFITVSLRPGTVCGVSPRQRFDVLVNILTINALINKRIIVHGGEQRRTNIHIDDMINIYKLMLEVPAHAIGGEEFNVSFENYSVLETAQRVKSIVGNDVSLEIDEDIVDKRSYRLDSSKFIKRFDYNPLKTVADAVLEIKTEFEKGKFQDGLTNDRYYDVRTLKSLYATGEI